MTRVPYLLLALICGCLLNQVNDSLMAPDKYVTGTLARVERAEEYEPRCGLLSRFLGRCVNMPLAYEAVVTDAAGERTVFYMFAVEGDTVPSVGRFARWHLHRRELKRLGECNPYNCAHDVAYALDSDEDVSAP